MLCIRIVLLIALLVSATPVRAQDEFLKSPQEFSGRHYKRFREQLDFRRQPWVAIPWQATITDARMVAAREKKPVFLMVNTGACVGFVWGNGVIAREAILNDPQVIEVLRTHFVAVGVDNADNLNLAANEKQFLIEKDLHFSTQGYAAIAADGTVLARGGGFEAAGARELLREALEKFDAERMSTFSPVAEPPPPTMPAPPEGGLVLYVTWKVVGDYGEPQSSSTTGDGHYDQQFASAVGADRLWVRQDENDAMAVGQFPDSLARRMARCYLSYVCADPVEAMNVNINGHLPAGAIVSGSFTAATGEEQGKILGVIKADDGQITGLDLMCCGWATRVEDCGFAASLTVVPRGEKVPVVMYFTLAKPTEPLSRIPPFRIRDQQYWE